MPPDRWLGLVLCLWILGCAGMASTFALYSPVLKAVGSFDQRQVAALAVAKDLGECLGIIPGLLCDFMPPWMMLLIGSTHFFLGFGTLWLGCNHVLQLPGFLQVRLQASFTAWPCLSSTAFQRSLRLLIPFEFQPAELKLRHEAEQCRGRLMTSSFLPGRCLACSSRPLKGRHGSTQRRWSYASATSPSHGALWLACSRAWSGCRAQSTLRFTLLSWRQINQPFPGSWRSCRLSWFFHRCSLSGESRSRCSSALLSGALPAPSCVPSGRMPLPSFQRRPTCLRWLISGTHLDRNTTITRRKRRT